MVRICYNYGEVICFMIYNFEDLSFRILTIEHFYHKEGFFDVKMRPCASLSFRINGTGVFEIGDKRLTVNKGDVLFIPANTPYKVEYSVSESIVVHFEQCNYYIPESISPQNQSATYVRFQKLLEVWNREHSVNQAKSMIYDILYRVENDSRAMPKDVAFDRCVDYIDKHYFDTKLDVEQICNVGYISVSSLQRAFKEYFGISPKQYIIKLRMNMAVELLMKNELSIAEIASACGFTDEKYFSRAFKNKYGYPPSQLRKHMII